MNPLLRALVSAGGAAAKATVADAAFKLRDTSTPLGERLDLAHDYIDALRGYAPAPAGDVLAALGELLEEARESLTDK